MTRQKQQAVLDTFFYGSLLASMAFIVGTFAFNHDAVSGKVSPSAYETYCVENQMQPELFCEPFRNTQETGNE